MKIFVSISCYDSLLDASIASILSKKKITNHKVFTSLSYSKKNLSVEFFDRYFDHISYIGAENEINQNKNFLKNKISIRQFYSIFYNLNKAIKMNYDFMIVLNSGSWLLDGKKINNIIAKLRNFKIGFRAMKYTNMKRISCDDHFIFFNLKNMKNEKNIFLNFQKLIPFDLKYGGIHTLLNNFFNKFNYQDIYIYSDLSKSVGINGKPSNYLLPLNFDVNFKLLHSNKREKIIEVLRYKYLNYYAKNYFDEFIYNQIKIWNNNNNVLGNKGIFFYKENLINKIKNILLKKQSRNWGYLESIE
jgi:hypothetical protein